MTKKAESILHEALTMNPDERALLAHCLISSLDKPSDINIETKWIKLAEERLAVLEKNPANTITWDSIKKKLRK